ncbi:aldo/keto reductase [Campylobacter sp. JMF_04 NA10]|uniref:aldo/keto reductase n=1 Tax=Campylobacter sp. JMF_04 NA10 TaxID=2983824 RepID=UPI0022EA02EB|nr:aldo/keto reductase [Campylobacter sp. JMF_04 NA10]MDA3076248.1 aldo/keto reductase [Campylobacter sp. JMF_04 NA10]
MKTRKLGNIEVSPIGIGCMGFSHGYGQIPSEDYSIEAIRTAFEFGCSFFDTSEVYGAQLYHYGHNEQILGKAVKEFRNSVVLATKLMFEKSEISAEGSAYAVIKKHLEKSLENLQTDYVDLYYLHRINPEIPVEIVAEAMGKLIDEKLIRGWGLSQVAKNTIQKAHEITPVSAVQNLYNMVERDCESEVLPYCLANNIGLVPFSPTASGLLSGKLNAKSDFSHSDDVRKFIPQLSKENMQKNAPLVELVSEFAKRKNATPAQIALAWMLHKYPNVVPIPGSKNKERILENLGAWSVELSESEFSELQSTLDKIEIHGHRGIEEFQGGGMKDWGKK